MSKDNLPETRVKVEYYKDGELRDVTEGVGIAAAIVQSEDIAVLLCGSISGAQVADMAEGVIQALIEGATQAGALGKVKALMLAAAMGVNGGGHE